MFSKNHKKKLRNRKKLILSILLLLLVIGLAFAIHFFYKFEVDTLVTQKEQKQEVTVKSRDRTVMVLLSEIIDTKNLQLINSKYAFDSGGALPDLASSNNGVLLRTDVLTAVSQLLNETRAAVGGQLALNSGYRSSEEQQQIYFNTVDKSYVQPPGHSEHETGLAVDIEVQNVADVENSPQSQYLIQNAWKYGFILRYPRGKTQITGIANEPWHFRYVGIIHAQYMTEHNLVLEEYIELLKEKDGYSLNKEGKTYNVRYEIPQNNQLSLIYDKPYEITSDNTGGYIITSWKE